MTFTWKEGERDFCLKLLSLFKIDGKGVDTLVSEGQLQIFAALVLKKSNRINIISSTQYGKSLIVALACIILSCVEGEMISIPAPDEAKARIIMRYYLQHLGDHPIFYSQLEKQDKLDKLVMETSRDRLTLKNRGGVFILSVHAKDSNKGFEAAMGEGSKYVIEDESGLIPDAIESTIFRMLAGKGPDAVYVKIGNPFYRNHFYKSAHDDRYLQIVVDYKQGIREGRYDIEFIEEARMKPNFDILYGCKFPDADAVGKDGYYRLLTDEEVKRSTVDKMPHSGFLVLGVDPAAGGDNSAIVLKSANHQEVVFNQQLDNVMDLVGVVADKYRLYGAGMIVIDRTGLGEGVYRRLQEMEFPTRGINFGESADEKDFYQNKKAELYWAQRNWLLGGGRLFKDNAWQELTLIKYKNNNGVIKIQPKEELFKQGLPSPNVVDAAILTQAVSQSSIKNAMKTKRFGTSFHDSTKSMMQMPDTGGETTPFTVWRG